MVKYFFTMTVNTNETEEDNLETLYIGLNENKTKILLQSSHDTTRVYLNNEEANKICDVLRGFIMDIEGNQFKQAQMDIKKSNKSDQSPYMTGSHGWKITN